MAPIDKIVMAIDLGFPGALAAIDHKMRKTSDGMISSFTNREMASSIDASSLAFAFPASRMRLSTICLEGSFSFPFVPQINTSMKVLLSDLNLEHHIKN